MSREIGEYIQPPPQEWHTFVRFAQRAIDPDRPMGFEVGRVESAFAEVSALPDDQLEDLRYFAHGASMSGLARYLSINQTRQLVTDLAAARLHGSYFGDELRVDYLKIETINQPFQVLGEASFQELPPAERLLSNALMVANMRRRATKAMRQTTFYDPIRMIMQGNPAGEHIGSTITAGIVNVLQAALLLATGDKTGAAPITEAAGSAAALQRLIPFTTVARCARLRVDELEDLNFLHSMLRKEAGRIILPREVLYRPPPPMRPAAKGIPAFTIHRNRLGCPARSVTDLLRLIYQILPEIIFKAGDYRN